MSPDAVVDARAAATNAIDANIRSVVSISNKSCRCRDRANLWRKAQGRREARPFGSADPVARPAFRLIPSRLKN
jgi:hypothetical protein